MTVPDSDSLDLTTGMTLEAWVRPNAGGAFRTVGLPEALVVSQPFLARRLTERREAQSAAAEVPGEYATV